MVLLGISSTVADYDYRAKTVLEQSVRSAVSENIADGGDIELTVSGIGHFANSVLFATIVEDRHLERVRKVAGMSEFFVSLWISGHDLLTCEISQKPQAFVLLGCR